LGKEGARKIHSRLGPSSGHKENNLKKKGNRCTKKKRIEKKGGIHKEACQVLGECRKSTKSEPHLKKPCLREHLPKCELSTRGEKVGSRGGPRIKYPGQKTNLEKRKQWTTGPCQVNEKWESVHWHKRGGKKGGGKKTTTLE